jgi:glucose-6-phosphate dehydrogenase assembly protein OpcA
MTLMEKKIQLTDISKELNRLWDQAQGQNQCRASLFNLILYLQKSEQAIQYQSLVRSVISKYPGRIIVIQADTRAQEEYLRTTVSSEVVEEGALKIFCEIIQIEVAGALTERVPFIILPHILPDLPTFLLWTEDPAVENQILPKLETIADRIIFDAANTPNLQRYSQKVFSLMEHFHCAVSDINWAALWGWRRIIEQTFETQEAFFSLAQTEAIRIHYNAGQEPSRFLSHPEIRAAYLQAWLASRMNWKFQQYENVEGNIRLVYRRPLHEIVILLLPQDIPELPPSAIISLEIESLKDRGHYVFKRHPKANQVFIQYSNKERCDLPTIAYLSGMQEGQEVIGELFYPPTGSHYHGVLEIMQQIPWK